MAYLFRLAFALLLSACFLPAAYSQADGQAPEKTGGCGWFLRNDSGTRQYNQCVDSLKTNLGSKIISWYQIEHSSPDVFYPLTGVYYCDSGYASGGICSPVPECSAETPWDPVLKQCSAADSCELLDDLCAGSQGFSKRFMKSGYKVGLSIICMPPSDISGTINMLPGCNRGCMGTVSGYPEFNRDSSGNWFTFGLASMTGSSCDPGDIDSMNGEKDPTYVPEEEPKMAEQPNGACPNGQLGDVNGVRVCMPFNAKKGTVEEETKDNGDGTKTDTKTEVECKDGKCEVTKKSTTTNTSTNTTVNTTTTTTTVDKSTFCRTNPTASVCKNEQGEEEGAGKFGGSCSGGFTCDGDALQCAIAKEQHKRNCEMSDNLLKSDEYKEWQKEKAKGWDGKSSLINGLEGNREHTISIDVGDKFIGSGSCPSDQTIDLPFSTSFTIPFSAMCPWLRMLGQGFVIFAYIAGALIIVRKQS